MTDSRIQKKRISYLTFASLPSRAAHCVNIAKMCEAMSRAGYDVTLYAKAAGTKEEIFEHYLIQTGFEIRRISVPRIRFLGRMLALTRLYLLLRKEKQGFLFTRDVFNGYLACRLKSPFLFELHELPATPMRRFLFRRVLRSQDLVRFVFISGGIKAHFEKDWKKSLGRLSWTVTHDGVDLKDFSAPSQTECRRKLGLSPDVFLAGYTGSLFPGRGVDLILDVASELQDVMFLIVGGEGRYLSRLEQEIKQRGMKNVYARGFVPYRQIPEVLSACDCLLMPYQQKVLHRQKKHDTVSYMSPLKLFEYMASRRPIISSRLKVLQEVLTHTENALLAEPDKAQEWVDAVKWVKENKEQADQMAQRAWEDVLKFSWDKRIEDIFQEISV